MKAVRFRCPKCRSLHSAPVARIGQVFPCKVCFGPLIVPEPTAGAAPSEVPFASPSARPAAPTAKPPTRVRRPAVPVPVPVPVSQREAEAEPRPSMRWLPSRGIVVRGAVALALIALVVGAVAGIRNLGKLRREVALAKAPPSQPDVRALPSPAIEAPAVLPAPELKAPPALAKPVPRVDDPGRLVLIRRQSLDQEALRRQLAQLPELAADDKTRSGLIALHGVPQTLARRKQAHLDFLNQQVRDNQADAVAEAFKAIQQTQGVTTPHRSSSHRAQARHKPAAAPHPPATAPTLAHPTMHVARDEGAPHDMLAFVRKTQPELAALPWRMGDECHLGREPAEDLQTISRALRNLLVKVTPPGEIRPDADKLRAALIKGVLEKPPADKDVIEVIGSGVVVSGLKPGTRVRISRGPLDLSAMVVPAAIPALQQLLMAERTPVRLVLAEILEKIPGRDATRALARLAMFDLAPEVRDRALVALKARPVEDCRPALLEGLRYPWSPVADHAAEALVALGDRETVPALIELLDRPDPVRARNEVREGKPVTLVSSVVQVNHLRNCVLCHAPSGDPEKDYVRGRVPDESVPIPPPGEYYANSSSGLFVRAEVTYLRQDFSATQPVEESGPWPNYQRYDYLVAERVVASLPTDPVLKTPETYPQRESILFALRELTGRDLGGRSDDWKAAITDAP